MYKTIYETPRDGGLSGLLGFLYWFLYLEAAYKLIKCVDRPKEEDEKTQEEQEKEKEEEEAAAAYLAEKKEDKVKDERYLKK